MKSLLKHRYIEVVPGSDIWSLNVITPQNEGHQNVVKVTKMQWEIYHRNTLLKIQNTVYLSMMHCCYQKWHEILRGKIINIKYRYQNYLVIAYDILSIKLTGKKKWCAVCLQWSESIYSHHYSYNFFSQKIEQSCVKTVLYI